MQFENLKHEFLLDQEVNTSLPQRCFNHPMFQHIKMLMVFFISQVALLFADIVTDVLSAFEFFSRGHNYWGMFTLVPIFAPFGAKVFMTFVNFSRCLKIMTQSLWGYKIPGESALQIGWAYFMSLLFVKTNYLLIKQILTCWQIVNFIRIEHLKLHCPYKKCVMIEIYDRSHYGLYYKHDYHHN